MNSKIVPYRINEKWGYCEFGTKNIIIPVLYEYVYPFDSNRLGMARFGGKWGLIDIEGNEITGFIYDGILDFSEGFYGFELDDKKGFLDQNGTVVISPIYDNIRQFKNGYAAIQIGSHWGVINKQGELLINPIYDWVDFDDIDQGFCSVLKDKKWGCINSNGEIQIPLRYNYRVEFFMPHNIAAVAISDRSIFDSTFGEDFSILNVLNYNEETGDFDPILGKDGKKYTYDDYCRIEKSLEYFTFINKENRILTDVRYEEAYPFGKNDSLTAIKLDGKYGFIDTEFNVVVNPIFQEVQPFSEGLAQTKLNGKYGFINRTGDIVIEHIYSSVINGFFNGIAQVVDSNYKPLYINSLGQEFSLGIELDDKFENFDYMQEFQPWKQGQILTCSYTWWESKYFIFKINSNYQPNLIHEGERIDLLDFGLVDFAFEFGGEPYDIAEVGVWMDGLLLLSHYSEKYADLPDYELVPFGYIDDNGIEYWQGDPHKRLE